VLLPAATVDRAWPLKFCLHSIIQKYTNHISSASCKNVSQEKFGHWHYASWWSVCVRASKDAPTGSHLYLAPIAQFALQINHKLPHVSLQRSWARRI